MRRALILLCLILGLAVSAHAATLSWEAPTTYEDGTPLPPGEILEYNVYKSDAKPNAPTDPMTLLGTVKCVPACSPTQLAFTLNNADRGKWVIVTAQGKGGESSQLATIRWFPPAKALNLRIK
jgi:hypothetical protein